MNTVNGHDFQVGLPNCIPPSSGHSIIAITLCPGLEEVIMFGGSDEYYPNTSLGDYHMLAETTVITFGE